MSPRLRPSYRNVLLMNAETERGLYTVINTRILMTLTYTAVVLLLNQRYTYLVRMVPGTAVTCSSIALPSKKTCLFGRFSQLRRRVFVAYWYLLLEHDITTYNALTSAILPSFRVQSSGTSLKITPSCFFHIMEHRCVAVAVSMSGHACAKGRVLCSRLTL